MNLARVFRGAVAPCIILCIAFGIYCFTIGKVSRDYFMHQGPQERYGIPLVVDEASYVTIADNLAHGNGYRMDWPNGIRTARRMPVYPLMLAGLFKLFGSYGFLGLTLNCIFLVAALFLVSTAAKLLLSVGIPLSISTARWALVFTPSLYYFGSLNQTEALSVFWAALMLILLLSVSKPLSARTRSRSALLIAILGIICGLATLTRPESIVVVGLIGVFLVILHFRRAAPSYWIVIFVSCFLLLFVIWIIHNAIWLKAFVPFTTTGGTTFYGAHNDMVWGSNRGSWGDPPRLLGPEVWTQLNGLGETQREHELLRMGVEWLRERNVGDLLLLEGYKLGRLWFPYEFLIHRHASPMANIIISALFLPFWGLALWGLRFLFKQRMWLATTVLLIFPVANTLAALVFYGSARFRITSYPALALLAAIGVGQVAQQLVKSRQPRMEIHF